MTFIAAAVKFCGMSVHLCAGKSSLCFWKCKIKGYWSKAYTWDLEKKWGGQNPLKTTIKICFWWAAIGCIRKKKYPLPISGEEGRVRGHPEMPGRWGARKRREAMRSELMRTEGSTSLFIPAAHRVPSSKEGLRRARACLQDTERLSGILISGLIAALCIYPHVWLQCPSGAAV